MSAPESPKGTPPGYRRAVALSWSGRGAPVVSAKGKGLVADEIVRLARESEVPMHEDVHLVQALGEVDLGAEIPEALYVAVAQVLAFAYELSGKHQALKGAPSDSDQTAAATPATAETPPNTHSSE